jgi:hypothetical protein
MPSEPNWSKQISNASICFWFYILAWLNAIIAVAGAVGVIFMLMKPRMTAETLGTAAGLLTSGSISFISAWFLFVVCNRGLNV